MRQWWTPVLVLACALFLGACASAPKFDSQGVDRTLTPEQAVKEIEARRDARIIWGGMILSSSHLKDNTQIEILSYPLDSDFRPDIDAAPLGRFLIVKHGFIETADYETGRVLSVSGVLRRSHSGKIGEADYSYPVVEPDMIHLWPRGGGEPKSSVHFGFGLNILR